LQKILAFFSGFSPIFHSPALDLAQDQAKRRRFVEYRDSDRLATPDFHSGANRPECSAPSSLQPRFGGVFFIRAITPAPSGARKK
jgi:hypothetical protein